MSGRIDQTPVGVRHLQYPGGASRGSAAQICDATLTAHTNSDVNEETYWNPKSGNDLPRARTVGPSASGVLVGEGRGLGKMCCWWNCLAL